MATVADRRYNQGARPSELTFSLGGLTEATYSRILSVKASPLKTAVLLAALAAGGCAHFSHKKPPVESAETGPAQPPLPAYIGKVAMVNEELKFVLIEASLSDFPEPGTALKCMRNGQEAAIVAVSAERKRPFVSADIVKGTPQQGDEVFQ